MPAERVVLADVMAAATSRLRLAQLYAAAAPLLMGSLRVAIMRRSRAALDASPDWSRARQRIVSRHHRIVGRDPAAAEAAVVADIRVDAGADAT